MPVHLVPMSAERFPAWLERSRDEYERDLIVTGESGEDARRHAAASMEGVFSSGVPTAHNAVFDLVDELGRAVGYLWVGRSGTGDDGSGDDDPGDDGPEGDGPEGDGFEGDGSVSRSAGGDSSRDDTSWWIWDVLVDDEHRGRGIGREAMLLAEEYARSQGAQTLGLSVFAFNAAARGLYDSLGYEAVSVKMRKSL